MATSDDWIDRIEHKFGEPNFNILCDALEIIPVRDREWSVDNCIFIPSGSDAVGQAIHADVVKGRHVILLYRDLLAEAAQKRKGKYKKDFWEWLIELWATTIVHEIGHLRFEHGGKNPFLENPGFDEAEAELYVVLSMQTIRRRKRQLKAKRGGKIRG